MSGLRLYREIYRVNHSASGQSYTLITPSIITAAVYLPGDILVEAPTVVAESTGRYFTEIDNNLYTFDNVYELRWSVVYVAGGPNRILSTYFKYSPNNIIFSLDTYELASEEIDYIIVNQK